MKRMTITDLTADNRVYLHHEHGHVVLHADEAMALGRELIGHALTLLIGADPTIDISAEATIDISIRLPV